MKYVDIVFLLSIARLMLNEFAGGSDMDNRIKLKSFRQGDVISLRNVVVAYNIYIKSHIAEGLGFKSCFVPFFFYLIFSFCPVFWLVLFAYLLCCFPINMYPYSCYLIKCNKQK